MAAFLAIIIILSLTLTAVFSPGTGFFIALYAVLGLIAFLAALIVLRAVLAKKKTNGVKLQEKYALDEALSLNALCEVIRIPSVTPSVFNEKECEPFEKIYDSLHKNFRFLNECEVVKFNVARIYILRKQNSENSSLFSAVGVNAHIDVVSAPQEELWAHPPFGAEIDNGYIYGRGTLDMKGQLIACLSAVEHLHKSEAVNKDIYIFITHDEETNNEGARAIAKYLKSKNVKLDYILDEGGAYYDGKSFGVDKELALIGINEKGYLDVSFTSVKKAGHSAIPPANTAIEDICRAISAIQYKKNRAHINITLKRMFNELLPYMSFMFRIIFANLWLFKPLVLKILGSSPASNALIRTTVVPTVIEGGDCANVVPGVAKAVFNCRINPPDNVMNTVNYMKKRVKNIEIEVIQGNEPSPVSKTDTPAFANLKNAISATFGENLVAAPYQVVASTDCHEYYSITDCAFRFVPFSSFAVDMNTTHSINERLELKSFYDGVRFFINLLKD